jgi:hypothetical protein
MAFTIYATTKEEHIAKAYGHEYAVGIRKRIRDAYRIPIERLVTQKGIAAMNAQHPPRWIGARPEGWR